MVQGPAVWEIAVAGHMLSGATPEEGIKKEFQEELFSGHKLPANFKIKMVGSYLNNDIPNNHELVYLFEIICPGPFLPDMEEVEGKPVFMEFKQVLKDIKVNPIKYAQYSINALSAYTSIQKL